MATEVKFIRLGIHWQDQIFDLQVSRELTFQELKTQLPLALASIRVELPTSFTIQVLNKQLVIDETAQLNQYPLGNGDQLIINAKGE
ncbi:hypothetical protein [Limosilactobacillus equigenerosi]|uniref:Ubiquitin-like domain-containing protein n=1 Tax=Limosilactobacillus equigenerosi DSM 18793 = JCM 14505 TaxID=1423742 RepID=A0A0R1USC2_9LACO|nr:hypothetical protein [Limosilactobacillus equigenerosi]KRL95668.1 hypothetical protein FC21_GL000774 [Limosilactobacillus equigenerosi DSM 18793 = JCM 14505]